VFGDIIDAIDDMKCVVSS